MQAKLSVRTGGDPRRAHIDWQWRNAGVSKADFGDPSQASTFAFCVYDSSGLLIQAMIPSGAAWRETRTGFRYRDRAAEHGGIAKTTLTAATRRAVLRLRGQGAGVTVARPLAPGAPLNVQLLNDALSGAHCWQSISALK